MKTNIIIPLVFYLAALAAFVSAIIYGNNEIPFTYSGWFLLVCGNIIQIYFENKKNKEV